MKYKIVVVGDEAELEQVLNDYAAQGWTFNSLETEYTKYIVIFERTDDLPSQEYI